MEDKRFPFQLLSTSRPVADAKTPVFERHDYAVCTIEYVESGEGELLVNDFCGHAAPDSIYFLHKHSHHRYYPVRENPWHKLCVVADGTLMEQLLEAYGLNQVYLIENGCELKHFFHAFLQLESVHARRNERAAVIFHEFVEACSLHLAQQGKNANRMVAQLRLALEKELGGKFSLTDYAAAENTTPEHLIRLFRQEMACAPIEYRMRRRLEAAVRLLQYSELSVKEIAGELGFSDQYNFSNFFKKRTGSAPSAFRSSFIPPLE